MREHHKQMLTPPELAREWGVSPEKVRAFIEAGELPAKNMATDPNGRRPRYKIRAEDARRFEASRQVVPTEINIRSTKRNRNQQAAVKDYFANE